MTEQEKPHLIKSILDIGELILKSGGEVNRVEDTMTRLCRAYGFARADVFTITSSIVITVHTAEGEILTQTRRIRGYNMNLERVHLVNQLAREVCKQPVSLEELRKRIQGITAEKERPFRETLLIYGLVSAVFAVFYGGKWMEAFFSGITGMGICLLLQVLQQVISNTFVPYAICSAAGGLFLGILQKAGLIYLIEPAMMGNIMLMIPGIPFTNAIREMLAGDTMSGILRLCESLLRTVAIAAGFIIVMSLMGGV